MARKFFQELDAICEAYDPANIGVLFASHQDPDIISSLSLWLDFNPELKCYLSRLWTTFVPHFGGTNETFMGIPDEGMAIAVGKLILQIVPAHYLHSSGNFHLYDEAAKLFFSGDIGATTLQSRSQNVAGMARSYGVIWQ